MQKIEIIKQSNEVLLPTKNLLPSLDKEDGVVSSHSLNIITDNQHNLGIWECDIGRFTRQVKQAEFCYIISGECVFSHIDGNEIHLVAGDTVYFPPNSHGEWFIKKKLRKSYIILSD